MGRKALLTAATVALSLATPSLSQLQDEGTPGECIEIHKISGVEVEDDQNEESVQTQEGSSISTSNAADYMRIQSLSDGAEYELYYDSPSLLTSGAATSVAVEFSALVVEGSGSDWAVDLYDRAVTDTWVTIGDLSSAGSDWTTVSLAVSSSTLTDYLDSSSDDEMLVRVRTSSSLQLGYIDFTQITASGGISPTPSPQDEPTSPLTSPAVNPTTPEAPVAAPVAQPVEAPQPVIAPVTAPVAAPSPVVAPVTAPVAAPSPVVAPVTAPVAAPSPVVAPVTAPVAAPSPVVAPVTAPVAAPSPVVAPVAAPVATPEPVAAPVATPPVTVNIGSQERWSAFAQFVPDWEAYKGNLGNDVCDPLEECRTDPACCDTSSTAVCGNGFCEEGETRLACNADCTHHLSVCGNGICEQVSTAGLGTYHVNMYEDAYNCPVDCLDSPNLDVSSSVTGSCFMSDSTCDNVCGDGICAGSDTCESCPRDCGECPLMAGDGICSYPFEAAGLGDCDGSSITNFITYNGEDYATIDNAVVLSNVFEDASCTSSPLPVPAGWRLADWDADIAFELVMTQNAKFETGCLVFEEGNAASTTDGLQGDAETSCGIIPIVRYNGNRFAIGLENCASRLMIQRIKSSGSKTCPSCGNGGFCNTLTGKCACYGLWTGPTCERAIGDYSVPAAASSWYQPSLGVTWEWQIDGAPIPGGNGAGSLYDVELYDIDYSYSSAIIADLQSKGKTVMCYISAGTSEDFRDDINLFPEEVKGGIVSFGEGDTFPDEKWLDLRRLDLVAPIMLERLDIMQAKGCDAVEWDNADLPVHDLGLSDDGEVSVSVQIAYNAWIAAQTHARGMGVAMKNNNEAAAFLVEDYDMVVNEECWINGNCNNYWPWIKAGKPILNTEYFTTRCMYCTQANLMNLSTIKKVPDLTSCRVDCSDFSNIDSTQCSAASVSGTVSYPIDWTVGDGAVMNEDWCPMTLNTAADECPSTRFYVCDPEVGY